MSHNSSNKKSRPSLKKESRKSTSWEPIAEGYHKIVQSEGHYYHKEVILPNLLPLLSLSDEDSLVDIGCGQGILERAIPKGCRYLGVDISPSLLSIAKKMRKSRSHEFLVQDLTKKIETPNAEAFSHAVAILSLQNMEFPDQAIKNTAKLLETQGRFLIVLNHPCFRIPRVSSWYYDENKKLMSRKIDRYLSSMTIPIVAHPGKKQSATSLSFHFPLSYWIQTLSKFGFVIDSMEEWISPKKSLGKRAKAENLCREEFPLFLLISCIKNR
ncbi:class I SAM-dependent methyltransferase [Chlamydia vaughanii]|uniref:class I SAM-dependent methyltransferase n=1 Tax=Chlamydia vaughanii TaxID=3112552 RepID=UPI0032B1E2FD